jgi:hypothetical protein
MDNRNCMQPRIATDTLDEVSRFHFIRHVFRKEKKNRKSCEAGKLDVLFARKEGTSDDSCCCVCVAEMS